MPRITPPRAAVRKILHLDLDAFFCSVEELENPDLRGKRFAVGGSPDGRGVVSSCSYAARMKGVRSAMPMGRALALCPDLIIVHGTYRRYSEYSRKVMDILGESTALVEQVSVDEAFLDLSDLPEPPYELARMLQEKVNSRLNLPCSLGAASNKLVAKIACDAGKARHKGESAPNSILVVEPGQEAAFLAPLPASALLGIGPKTAERLTQAGIHTIGDLQNMDATRLNRIFGGQEYGADLVRRAKGIDNRAVASEHGGAKSISSETTYERDTADREVLEGTIRWQSEECARRLRRSGVVASTVRIKIRWPDFTTHTRQLTLPTPTDLDNRILDAALDLFHAIWKKNMKVRLLGVGVSGISADTRQLSLWETEDDKERRLRLALDELRNRFGSQAVQSAKRLQKKRQKPENGLEPADEL